VQLTHSANIREFLLRDPQHTALSGPHIAQLSQCLLLRVFSYNSCDYSPAQATPKKDQGVLLS
jgi:hypothetical protein